MKLSKYCKIYPSPTDPGSVVLFSTLHASALQVPVGLINDMAQDSLSAAERETLSTHGFLVPDAEEERLTMLGYVRDVNNLDKVLSCVLVLNLDCNLGCRYCFEGTRKGRHYLSDGTADLFVDFVKRTSIGKEELRITFYGGEPLLSVERIVSISHKLRAVAGEQGLKYSFFLVTNGTLLTPAIVRELVPLGLTAAKVTLDGPKEIHDLFRPFKSGVGSFDVIVRNIRDVCDTIRIQIGGNYTQEHFREFPRLLDYLSDVGLTPERIPIVKFDPVVNETREFAPPDFNDGCASINEPWVAEAGLYLREEVLKRGYRLPKIMPALCSVLREGNFVVNYDGALYTCPGMIGRSECRIGDLTSDRAGLRASHDPDAWKNDTCLACEYLPLCFGGCKYMKLLRDGSMRGINCQKEYFDRTLAGLVLQDIKYDL